ncbi:Cystinosin [Orchesella cincta]|uniref:Cystinosin n=1 Tax=Orchesella cincta TaxID=48709 RepID=A0A1D2NEE1_ORCCI|nr:Cystinosin [Orchesella cincta]
MDIKNKRTGKMIFRKHRRNTNARLTSLVWPSRFLSVVLFMLCGKAITAQNASNGAGTINPPPLRLSAHDLSIKVGQTANVLLFPTENFKPVFQNVTESIYLVFHSSVPEVIQPLDNITLADATGLIEINHTLNIFALDAGKLTVTSQIVPQNISIYESTNIYLRVEVYKLETLLILSNIVGWIYFAAWSISFYPQIIQNYQRKSVRGLSLDFVFLNITGFSVYAIFNIGLYWFKSMQQEYYVEYPHGVIPVQLNDVVFTMHALFACGITVVQCLIYDRGSQTVSDTGKMLLCTLLVFVFVIFIVAASKAISWLTFLTWCSYVKLVITLIKYVPQAYLNWYRKSTSGWSIGNVLLDFTGGVFSLTQMIFIAYNHNDWASFFGDLTKFGLGLFSILFDIFFIVQHYVLYRSHAAYDPIEGGDNPSDPNQYDGDITTSNHFAGGSVDSADMENGAISSGDNNYDNQQPPISPAFVAVEQNDSQHAPLPSTTNPESTD